MSARDDQTDERGNFAAKQIQRNDVWITSVHSDLHKMSWLLFLSYARLHYVHYLACIWTPESAFCGNVFVVTAGKSGLSLSALCHLFDMEKDFNSQYDWIVLIQGDICWHLRKFLPLQDTFISTPKRKCVNIPEDTWHLLNSQKVFVEFIESICWHPRRCLLNSQSICWILRRHLLTF